MVAPLTGPVNKQTTTLSHFHNKNTWKQAKPVDQPLPYNTRNCDVAMGIGQTSLFQALQFLASRMENSVPPNYTSAAQLAAYERFRGQISDKAQMGVFLVELEQAARMIATRGLQIAGLVNALRRLDFVSFGKIINKDLNVISKPAKGFASDWLEYSFGWSPMVSDIYSAVNVLQNPIKSLRPHGSAFGGRFSANEVSGVLPNAGSKVTWYADVSAKVGAEVTITNHNLFLANNLGLVNPLTIAWELIPFSFVVDWFVTVESFLSSGTDLYGLGIRNAWNSTYRRGPVYEYWKEIALNRYAERWSACGYMSRSLGLPGPQIFVRPWKVPSWKRALNAISLVVQGLSK